jgi:F0F1-type ATP synthase assembly protein I
VSRDSIGRKLLLLPSGMVTLVSAQVLPLSSEGVAVSVLLQCCSCWLAQLLFLPLQQVCHCRLQLCAVHATA